MSINLQEITNKEKPAKLSGSTLPIHTYHFETFVRRMNDSTDLEELIALGLPRPCPIMGVWIAGGALRRSLLGEPITSDVDYFFRNEAARNAFVEKIEKDAFVGSYKIVSKKENEYNVCYRLKLGERDIDVQLVFINYYETHADICDSFDFSICQFVYDGTNLYTGIYALSDLYRRRLVVHKISYAVASFRRVLKYTSQGFYFCTGAIQEFLKAVVEKPSTATEKVLYID